MINLCLSGCLMREKQIPVYAIIPTLRLQIMICMEQNYILTAPQKLLVLREADKILQEEQARFLTMTIFLSDLAPAQEILHTILISSFSVQGEEII